MSLNRAKIDWALALSFGLVKLYRSWRDARANRGVFNGRYEASSSSKPKKRAAKRTKS